MAVGGAGGRSGGAVLVRSFQEIHGGDPSGPPAFFGVHVSEGGALTRGGTLQGGEALQLLREGRAAAGSDCRSAALRRRCRRAVPEQHHSTAALIGNMVSTCSPNVWGGGRSGDKWRSLPLTLSLSLSHFPFSGSGKGSLLFVSVFQVFAYIVYIFIFFFY